MYGNLSDEEKEAILREIMEKDITVFSRAVDLLRPKVVVPVAGGYAIRGLLPTKVNWQQNRRLNMMEVVDYHRIHGQFKTRIVPLQPGMELDGMTGEVTKGEYQVWSREELEAYFSKLSTVPVARLITTKRTLGTLPHLMEVARRHLWQRQKAREMFPEYRVYFDVPGQPHLMGIDLRREEMERLSRTAPLRGPYLKMTLDQDTLLEWLLGFEDFNMLDSGHRIAFYRVPNTYVQEAYYLMSMLRV